MVTRERQAARIRNLYLKAILRQEIAFFDMETSTGEVVGRMSGDTVLIQDAMGEKVGKFIQLISTFFGGFIVAFVQGWLLSLVMLSIIPLIVLAGAIMSIVVSKMASTSQTAYGDATIIVQQAIGSIRTVASFTSEKISVYNYKNALRNAYNSSVQEGLAAGVGLGFAMFFMFCSYSLGIWYGGKLILDKSKGYSGADVINVIFALSTGSLSLGQALPCMTSFAAGQVAAHKMFETINRRPVIDAYNTSGRKLDDICGDIEFRDVYFSYPARSAEHIFRGFSLLINCGTTTALVGESGSGKSTVISLIERFYDPQAGEVLIDGINIKDLQLRWLRGKIGLVSQEPVLFASSIKDNISYGKDNATTEEIRVAAELCNASKFIDKMPRGLDTMVGEHGTQLSGGQKQRIAIARAILNDPKILLLDKATSALDAKSERVVQEALDRVMLNRTTVIVAHRLSTVRNADTIAVVHGGSIVEKGSHSELLKDSNGAYSQLIRLQEMNQNSDPISQSDNEKRSLSLDGTICSSQDMPIKHSISRDSSFGNSSPQHSFSAGFVLPVGSDFFEHATDAPNSSTAEQSKEVPLSRLTSLNKPEIPILLFGAAFSIINGTIYPAFGAILSGAINTFYQPPDKLKKDSKFWSLMFLIFGVVSLAAEPAKSYFFGVAGSRLIRRIRFMAFEKVVNMEIAWFDDSENSSGAIGARLSADAASVRSLVGDALSLIVQNFTTLIAGLLIAFIANWQLSLIILAMIPLICLNGLIQVKFMQGFSADAKVMYEKASQVAVANDAVGSIRTVASFSAEEKVMELYKKKCEGPMRTGIRQGLISGIGFGVSFFLLFCADAACFYAGARLVEDGKTMYYWFSSPYQWQPWEFLSQAL
ncbi:LOW QUALITY PROTEIN: ABC transporter B family member 4-like [Phalaenopsis equestris]|uniref:LOW QUALITY PROTEIN: ABC transporter B family member 4-like n=1 Tax=Phalaenopsis equestris TaxID=78828 RepID=UPI0009E3BE58|nr:LOW QUALITY PROTEIN: ABC transporter B family member 4-like [Phalaenopsis equestris]